MDEKYKKFLKVKEKQAKKDREEKLEVVKKISEFVKTQYDCRVYLFGSLLRENLGHYSDIDIMVKGLNLDYEAFNNLRFEVEEIGYPHIVDFSQEKDFRELFLETIEYKEV